MKFLLNIFLILFIAFSSQIAGAQKLLTLEEAIATALQYNYQIQLAKNDSLVAAIDYGYRNAIFLPSLNSSLGTTWNNNNQRQTLADGSERKSNNIRSNNIQGNVSLSWVLFNGFKMFATRDKAAEYLNAGAYAIQEQVINTIAAVVKTYYNIARQKQQIKATEIQINLTQERAKLAQYKLDIGTGAKPDVLQSNVDVNAQKSLKLQQETFVMQLKDQLAQAMNSGIKPEEFDILDTIPLNDNIALSDILSQLESTSPTLQLAKSNINIAALTLKESKADQYPTLTFNSAYNYSKTNNKKVINQFSPLFNQSNGYNFGLVANIPIFNQFRVKRQIRQSELNLRNNRLMYDNQKSLLTLALLNAFRSYEQQKQALILEEENIKSVNELVSIVWQTYKLGMATLIQLREAQLSQAQAYNRLIEARYNTKVSETELMRLKGDIVK